MILTIKQIHKYRGTLRYSVGFKTGLPVEFLIQEPPEHGSKREWQALFARSVIQALWIWCKHNYPEGAGE